MNELNKIFSLIEELRSMEEGRVPSTHASIKGAEKRSPSEDQIASYYMSSMKDDSYGSFSIHSIPDGTRDYIFMVDVAGDYRAVIKSKQGPNEKGAIKAAGDFSPRQLIHDRRFIVEEHIPGKPIKVIESGDVKPRDLGILYGDFLRKMHERDYVFNDALVFQNDGSGNDLLDQDGNLKVIDFGNSIKTDNHPDYTTRQLKSMLISHGSAPTEDNIAKLEENLDEVDPTRVKFRDIGFLREGLIMNRNLSRDEKEEIDKGFAEGYDCPPGSVYSANGPKGFRVL